ncbi:MAG: 3-deoxy-D-manno-octulosonic acid transferase [Verrucomicrobiota bacterium]
MPKSIAYLIYNILLPVVLLIGFPSFIIKGIKRGGLARNFRHRFGYYGPTTRAHFQGSPPIWIHAVSVGEILLAKKIIASLHEEDPEVKMVLSTTTTTGFAVATEGPVDYLTVIHNPLDLPWIVNRVIRLIQPRQLNIVESEIWPNLLRTAKREGVFVGLANARLSLRSEKRYQKFSALIRPVFSQLDFVTVPFEADIKRWSNLGIARERIEATGSVKFDNATTSIRAELIEELSRWLNEMGMPEGSRILLAGSTHAGEETLLAEISAELKRETPALELVIVPRHAERGPEIAGQLKRSGFDPILRSQSKEMGSAPRPVTDSPRGQTVWIADTTGELRGWFCVSELVFIGKSLFGGGGQNPVEPILAGKPTVVGPRMENFSEVVADLRQEEALVQVKDEKSLTKAIHGLLVDKKAAEAMSHRGLNAMKKHRGAAQRTAELFLRKG